MAINGKSKELTAKQLKKLNDLVTTKNNITGFLSEKGIHLQTIRYVLNTGRLSEKTFKKLSEAGLV